MYTDKIPRQQLLQNKKGRNIWKYLRIIYIHDKTMKENYSTHTEFFRVCYKTSKES